jgi:hypothetical protein
MGTADIANVAVLNEIKKKKKVVNVSKRPKDRYRDFGAQKKKKQRDYRLKEEMKRRGKLAYVQVRPGHRSYATRSTTVGDKGMAK